MYLIGLVYDQDFFWHSYWSHNFVMLVRICFTHIKNRLKWHAIIKKDTRKLKVNLICKQLTTSAHRMRNLYMIQAIMSNSALIKRKRYQGVLGMMLKESWKRKVIFLNFLIAEGMQNEKFILSKTIRHKRVTKMAAPL